ncbi:MAG: PadR family transcriptional regulator [Actinomycetota bacterium]|nr:PadR family transcriptional regulator [Actinomycetota bacterium]
MLELAILGVLKDQELHGYELKKRLGETLGPLSSVSFGSLYPALKRLEAAGAVKVVEAAGSGSGSPIPMTGSLGAELAAFRARRQSGRGGRGKKVYGITERGGALFEEMLVTETQSGDDDRAFNLKLTFARYLSSEARLHLLERRRGQLVQRLANVRGSIRAGRPRLDSYTRSLREHSTEITERDISWLDQLIATERRHQPSAPVSPTGGPSAAEEDRT